jgi:hypothetical protein
MYYGNPSAISARNGTATFDFFDDAESNKFSDKWINVSGGGTGSYSSDYAFRGAYSIKNTGEDSVIVSKSQNFVNAIFEAKVMAPNNVYGMFIARASGTTKTYYGFRPNAYGIAQLMLSISSSHTELNNISSSDDTNAWADWKIITNGSSISTYYNNNLRNTAIDGSIISGLVGSRSASSTTGIYLDDVRVRKYASPEPSYNQGIEETP